MNRSDLLSTRSLSLSIITPLAGPAFTFAFEPLGSRCDKSGATTFGDCNFCGPSASPRFHTTSYDFIAIHRQRLTHCDSIQRPDHVMQRRYLRLELMKVAKLVARIVRG